MTAFELKILTDEQNAEFDRLVRTDGARPGDSALETFAESALAGATPLGATVTVKPVTNKKELVDILVFELKDVDATHLTDPRLWNYLMLLWRGIAWGTPKSMTPGFFVYGADPRHLYKHRLAGPYFLAKDLIHVPEVQRLLAAMPVAAMGNAAENLMGRVICRTEGSLVAASRLYVNPSTNSFKVGGPEATERYGRVLTQLDVTYDLWNITADDLMTLLPKDVSVWNTM